jgi:hypothetical protein
VAEALPADRKQMPPQEAEEEKSLPLPKQDDSDKIAPN